MHGDDKGLVLPPKVAPVQALGIFPFPLPISLSVYGAWAIGSNSKNTNNYRFLEHFSNLPIGLFR